MGISDIFSKRQKTLRGDVPDTYTYNIIPWQLRTQIIYILNDALGGIDFSHTSGVEACYKFMCNVLQREYGQFTLTDKARQDDYIKQIHTFILDETNHERVIDAIEISFRLVDSISRKYDYLYRRNANEIANKSIDELNFRFKEHGIGYQYISKEIVRIDSDFLHTETVKPALRLLNSKLYAGPQEEFLKAHEHYRHGNSKEALNECLKAFESIMKAICDKRGWTYNETDTAKHLINTCLGHGLIPSFWQSHFTSLKSVLESGIPTGRNKLGGHGQGSTPTDVPEHLTAYMIHMTASAIVFLVEAESKLP